MRSPGPGRAEAVQSASRRRQAWSGPGLSSTMTVQEGWSISSDFGPSISSETIKDSAPWNVTAAEQPPMEDAGAEASRRRDRQVLSVKLER